MPTVAETIAQYLVDAGITTVYGLPGGENLPLLDALRRQNIEFVLVRNESSAVYMADVAARLTGVPGVVLTTLGPGATNAYVGIAHAYLDRSPVLLITAETPSQLLPHHTHQVLDLQAVFRPVTAFSKSISRENVHAVMQNALFTMIQGRRSPVHLSLAKDVASQTVDDDEQETQTVAARKAKEAALDGAYRLLWQSKRPIIVVGLGLEPEQPYDELKHFAEVSNAPVIDTPKSKGALAADHPLWAGTIGLTHTDPVYELLDEADCIIAIGFDVVELVKPWDYHKPLIWIAGWENTDPPLEATYEFVGSIAPVLDSLARSLLQADTEWGVKRVREFHESQQKPLPATDDMHILPQMVLQTLAEYLPRNASIATDVGSHKIFTALNWRAMTPNRYFVSNGLSAMGFGLPAAIAAARITRQLSVCITGDGGLAMNLGELSLLDEMKLPVIIVLLNDAALNLIREGQIRSQYPVFGTEFVNPDYEAIAKGFGLSFYRVHNEATLTKSIRMAVVARKPALIEVLIDPAGYL
jgi:acetolactate synthase I/II/III large subunit